MAWPVRKEQWRRGGQAKTVIFLMILSLVTHYINCLMTGKFAIRPPVTCASELEFISVSVQINSYCNTFWQFFKNSVTYDSDTDSISTIPSIRREKQPLHRPCFWPFSLMWYHKITLLRLVTLNTDVTLEWSGHPLKHQCLINYDYIILE